MKKSVIIHPFLLAIFPVLSFYNHNKSIASLSQVMTPLIVSLGLASVIFFILKAITKKGEKAGLITSFFFISIYLFGHFRTILPNYIFGNFILHNYYILSVIWVCLLLAVGSMVATTKKHLDIITTYLNIVSIFLCIFPVFSIIIYEYNTNQILNNVTFNNSESDIIINQKSHKQLPDIYYIILDKYAGSDVLNNYFNFDNSEFINYLIRTGFYVASSSHTNYLKTEHSLASSLNMEYLNYLSDRLGDNFDKRAPIEEILDDFRVWRYLKTRGYKFIYFGNLWQPSLENKYADVNYNIKIMNSFSWVIYRTTILYPLVARLGFDYNREQWKRISYQFDKLAEIPNMHEPSFVFAHLLVPHPPYVFDEKGEYLDENTLMKRGSKINYLNQLKFTNQKVTELIETILAHSDTTPVIIIQSDHGTGPPIESENPDITDLEQRLPILNAYYLDGEGKKMLYKSITPVNSFRVIFNHIFNADLELLPDKSYFSIPTRPYHYIDVTTILKNQ